VPSKLIVCLGNPGSEYSTTRHNVGWWLADRLAESWGLGPFRRGGAAAAAEGRRGEAEVQIVKPLTYMNRSGQALVALLRAGAFDIASDLLVIVDDVALEPGRARLRASGSAGGHNGLKSIEATLGTRDYARLRIGVGAKPPGVDLADWVLSSPPLEERRAILSLLPELVECLDFWVQEGVEPAMNRCNSPGAGGPDAE
jgi:PTH1 family peptidyl-tRNA hydrolase